MSSSHASWRRAQEDEGRKDDHGEEQLENKHAGIIVAPLEESISVDEAIDRLGCGKFQHLILIAAGLCFSADAMEVTLLSFLSAVLKSEWSLSSSQAASITSSVFAGQMVGTIVLGRLGDRIGRRPVFLLAAMAISVFGVLTAMVNGYVGMLIMRTAVGFGVGGLVVPFDILAEFLPVQQRGAYLLYVEYFWTAGSMSVPVLAYLSLGSGETWNVFVLLCAIPCIASAVMGMYCVPESPRWLVSQGRLEEAMTVLREAAVTNGLDPTVVFPPNLRLCADEEKENSSYLELLKPKWRSLTLLIWGTWIGFAFGYYGTILIVTRVFQKENNGGSNDNEADDVTSFDYGSIFISCSAELVGTTLVILLVDKSGRVVPQAVSYLMGGLFVLVLSMSYSHSLILATFVAFCARIFEMMATCLTWVTTAEVLCTEIRTTGHSAANAIARLSAFCCPFLVESTVRLEVVGIIMAVIHVFTAWCAFHLPETKGLALGEIPHGKIRTTNLIDGYHLATESTTA